MKKELGQFYTTNSKYIIGNLLKYIQNNFLIIDQFAGNWDLLNLFENKKEAYDLDPKNNLTIKNDSLINPPNFSNKYVITNPPFLAKNKNINKAIYEKYDTDDLYKATIKSILEAEGGIIILPLNFLSSNDNKIREIFFERFQIIELNIFEEKVFDDTTYTVCSFFFKKRINDDNSIIVNFYPNNKTKKIELKKEYGYRFGGEVYNLSKSNVKIKRLLIGEKPNSKVFLRAVDTGTIDGKIKLEINDEYYFGKKTDRVFATIVFDKDFSLEEQKLICSLFNKKINELREKYDNLFLTNYRNSTKNMARKRIGFSFAYDLISNCILELGLDKKE